MEHSPGMYMMATASRTENENPQEYDSILSSNRQRDRRPQPSGENGSSGNGGDSLITSAV